LSELQWCLRVVLGLWPANRGTLPSHRPQKKIDVCLVPFVAGGGVSILTIWFKRRKMEISVLGSLLRLTLQFFPPRRGGITYNDAEISETGQLERGQRHSSVPNHSQRLALFDKHCNFHPRGGHGRRLCRVPARDECPGNGRDTALLALTKGDRKAGSNLHRGSLHRTVIPLHSNWKTKLLCASGVVPWY